ncbi:putative nitrate reductase alpha subunit domain protein [Mycobacterium xenopi 4042]|uniref:Putative nitrate reductase alpha subunit domain protein n=1 Tax=Mycobacterium xenopi 4042 TaxID=1299334 RepID=X7Z3B6_MYCXE|nr:putative nitrate reductase alpha subunit domain protein [Mycobacterium xenopi 4042]
MAEAILALSGTTNGAVAMQGWQALEERTGMRLADLAAAGPASTSPSRTPRFSRAR